MLNFLQNGYDIKMLGNGNEEKVENVLEEYIMLTLQVEIDFT